MFLILKFMFLIIAILGFFIYIKNKTSMEEEFIPIFLFAIITDLMFLSGILNFMKIFMFLIIFAGTILFVYQIYKFIKSREKIKIENYSSKFFFIIFLIVFAYLLKGVWLNHYDNFSHWGLIVKSILENDRLPNFQDTEIIFTAYPPGSACFIYFICKILGNSEGIMLYAQSILILSGVFSIFAFTKKDKKIGFVFLLFASIYFFVGNIYINQLLVDTLLTVLGISVLSIILYYKNNSKRALLYSIPITSLLILVKNSGIYFVILALIVWFIYFVKNKEYKNIKNKKWLIILILPFFMQVIWNCHVELVYDNSENSKHAMTISNYSQTVKQKNIDDINQIGNMMITKMKDLKNRNNQIFYASLMILFVLILVSFKNKSLRKSMIGFCSLVLISFFIYQISVFLMYIFSMPINEARVLAGYVRYYSTIVMFEYGVLCIALLKFINEYETTNLLKTNIIKITFVVLTLFPIILFKNEAKQLINKNKYIIPIRLEISQIIQENEIESKKSYLVYISNDENLDKDFLQHLFRYEFLSKNVVIINNFEEIGGMDKTFNYDYFIMLRKDKDLYNFIDIIKGEKSSNVIRFR